MTQTKIWVHAVWGIRGRNTLLANGSRQELLDHLSDTAGEQQIELGAINCWVDHIHCLFRLKIDTSPSEVVETLRKEAGTWIRKRSASCKRFSWEKEFFAASVSEGNLAAAKNYIMSQERLHANRTYREEVEAYFSLDFPVKNQ
jgi:REP element-mobilizing transposase RayT